MRKIITSHVSPPIPARQFDWCAFYDGDEETGCYGYGATEAEAVADFIENYKDDCDERLGEGSDRDWRDTLADKLETQRFTPWLRCPSTHCERRGECGHPKHCEAIRLPAPSLSTPHPNADQGEV